MARQTNALTVICRERYLLIFWESLFWLMENIEGFIRAVASLKGT